MSFNSLVVPSCLSGRPGEEGWREKVVNNLCSVRLGVAGGDAVAPDLKGRDGVGVRKRRDSVG